MGASRSEVLRLSFATVLMKNNGLVFAWSLKAFEHLFSDILLESYDAINCVFVDCYCLRLNYEHICHLVQCTVDFFFVFFKYIWPDNS
jgi:hypothetical protein